jgi:heat-inducible transcriptional repressor
MMDTSILKDKDRRVLNLIVENYLELGKPVSSGLIFQKLPFSGSPATIRNIMVRLEEKGYLSQPHTWRRCFSQRRKRRSFLKTRPRRKGI